MWNPKNSQVAHYIHEHLENDTSVEHFGCFSGAGRKLCLFSSVRFWPTYKDKTAEKKWLAEVSRNLEIIIELNWMTTALSSVELLIAEANS